MLAFEMAFDDQTLNVWSILILCAYLWSLLPLDIND